MKGRKLTLVLVMLLVLVCTLALTACHTHECETEWTYDNAGHWHKATCKHASERIDYEAHTLFKVEAKEATCTAEGNNQYFYCGVCNMAFKDEAMTTPTYAYAEVVPMKAHVYDQKVASPATLVKAATCTSKAVYSYTCVCGAVGTDTFESGEFTAHNLQLVPAVEATCMQAGNNAYYQCSDCEAYFRDEAATTPTNPDAEVLPIVAHTPVHHAGIPATCTQEGKAEYWTCSVCEKMYEDAYCTYEITSVRTIPTVAHTYGNIADAKYKATEATCKAIATYYTSCTVCGEKGKDTFAFGDYAAHVLSEIAAVAPTCTTPGSQKYYSCSVCEKFFADLSAKQETTPEQMVVASTGHKYDQQVVKTEYLKEAATCKTLGVYYTSCVCGKMDKNASTTFEGGAKGQHIAGSVVPRVEATCTVDGNIEYWICAVCDQNCRVNAEGKVVILKADRYEDEVDENNNTVNGLKIRAFHRWAEVVDAKCLYKKATCGSYATYYKSCSVCGDINKELVFETGTMLDHTITTWVDAKAPTCTEKGNVAYGICEACNKYVDKATSEVLGDDVSVTEIATPNNGKHYYTLIAANEYLYASATCESAAKYHKSCKYCGIIDEETAEEADRFFEYGDPLPHTYGAWVDAVAPDCLNDGNIKYCVCSVCNNFFDETYVQVANVVLVRKGHTQVEDPAATGALVSAATCTAKAVYKVSCKDCGILFDQTFTSGDYKEHTWGDLHQAIAADCVTEGQIAYYQCSECYQYFNEDKNVVTILATNPLGHKMVETILADGSNLISAASCTSRAKYDQVCERCQKTATTLFGVATSFENGEKLEHQYGALIAGVPATCDTTGKIDHYKCSECSQYFNAEKSLVGTTEDSLKINALGHKYINVIAPEYLDKPATCIKKAVYVKYCERCEKTSKEINPSSYETFEDAESQLADHVYGELVAAQPATCFAAGHIAHYKCSVCEEYFNDQKASISSPVEAQLTHNFTKETNVVKDAATCTTDAVHYAACIHCDTVSDTETYVAENSRLGHDIAATITTGYAATCTADGQKDHFYCDRCDKYLDANLEVLDTIVIAMLGHDYSKQTNEVFTPAACGVDAVHYYACSRCDAAPKDDTKVYTVEGSALAHVYGALNHGKPALCEEDGVKAHSICETCGKYFDVNNELLGTTPDCVVIPKLGHNYTAEVPAPKYFVEDATCITGIKYYKSCANPECGNIDPNGATFYAEGTTLDHCLVAHLQKVAAKDEFSYAINEFPAVCNYEHWICTLCEKIYADAMGTKLYDGNPYYTLARRTMAIGKMDGDKFDTNVDTTLALATGNSYTIGGIVPYVKDAWKQEGLVAGNRVAIQFAAKYFEYAATQTGVIARLTSGSYVKEFTAADLQVGNNANNIEAGSLLAIFNVAVDTDIKLEILAEAGFETYTFRLATGIEMIKFVEAVEETYWNPGNYEYYVCGGAFYKDGFAKEAIADIDAYLIPQLEVEVQLGNVVDNAFVAVGNNYSATLTETATDNVYLLEGAILAGKDGKAFFSIRLNAELASYFKYVAENEEVLTIVMADGTIIKHTLPNFKFEADGTYVITFEVEAGKSYTVSLRSPKSVATWLTFGFEIDADFVCPTLVEGVAATYWADGVSAHYTLTDDLGVVTRYEDIYCTQVVELEDLVSAQLELAISAGSTAYSFTRDAFAKYVLNGIVAHVENDAYTAIIKVADQLLNAYAGCDDSLVVAKLNNVDVTLAQLRAMVANGIEMEASKAQTLTFAIINPKDAADAVAYEFAIGTVNCPKFIATVAPTYFAVGINEHYKCAVTGKIFADENCTTEVAIADLTVAKLIPTAQAGSYDTTNNAFVLGGVYYAINYNSAEVAYILSGAVVSGLNLPESEYLFGYVIRFNDNFAKFYSELNNDAAVVKAVFANGKVVEFTKANAFEADGTIVFRGDASSNVIEFSLWNTVTNDWETYEIKNHSDLNRMGVLADAQVGTVDSTGAFLVGERYVYNAETSAFDKKEALKYSVSIVNAEYVVSGIVPSAQDKNGKDIRKYDFSLRFDYNFAKLFTEVADDVVVLRYVAPNGTVYATYTKAQVFANDISICFTGNALVDGTYKCQIMNADGSVLMEYRIRVAEDVVCPVYMYETAPNYWGEGWAQHYQNARVANKYYSDYECTKEISANDLFIDRLVFNGMTPGSYVVDANGNKYFGTYDYIDYSVLANAEGVYVINGRIPCCNDMRDQAPDNQVHKFVVKLNGLFKQTYEFYAADNPQGFTDSTVIAKVTIVTLEGTTVVEITKKDLVFEADGSIVFIYEAIKGAEIALDLMNPISGVFGELVYNFYVSPEVVYTHDVEYEVAETASYWAAGKKQAHCKDCDIRYDVVGSEGLIPQLLPTVQANGADVAISENTYSVAAGTIVTIKVDMAQFANCADDAVVLTIGTQTYTKAELAALNGVVEVEITATTVVTIANPALATPAEVSYEIVVA